MAARRVSRETLKFRHLGPIFPSITTRGDSSPLRVQSPPAGHANVAQSVEQLTRNEQVVRSIRIVGSSGISL